MSTKEKTTTEFELRRQIDDSRAEYDKAVKSDAKISAINKLASEIKDLMSEYAALLTSGAKKCRRCGNLPVGIRKGRGTYEIGCINCSANLPDDPEIVVLRSRGETSEEAVEKWNGGAFIGVGGNDLPAAK